MMIARGVTDQRRAERQLLASRRQLAEAQRIAHLGSWELDLETEELAISDEMARIVTDGATRFRVTTAPGQGTVVEASLPLTDPAEWRWEA
jgi:PAS domain-containing protein